MDPTKAEWGVTLDSSGSCRTVTHVTLMVRQVINLELMDRPPDVRAGNNPWPQWPRIFRCVLEHWKSPAHAAGSHARACGCHAHKGRCHAMSHAAMRRLRWQAGRLSGPGPHGPAITSGASCVLKHLYGWCCRRVDYGHAEAAAAYGSDPRRYAVMSKHFVLDQGRVVGIEIVQVGAAARPLASFRGITGFFLCVWRHHWQRAQAAGLAPWQTSCTASFCVGCGMGSSRLSHMRRVLACKVAGARAHTGCVCGPGCGLRGEPCWGRLACALGGRPSLTWCMLSWR